MLKINKLAKDIFENGILKSKKEKIDLNILCSEKIKIKQPKINELQISDHSEQLIKKITQYVNKRKNNCESQGLRPEYEFADYSSTILLRCGINCGESPAIYFLRKNNKELFKTINKMSWNYFEKFCKKLLEINNISKIELTKKNAEGVDFCGLYPLGKYFHSTIIPANFKIRIVGQIKHWSKKVNPKEVRSFSTYCTDIKNGEKTAIKDLSEEFKENKAPILGIFLTTSSFTKSALRFAEKEWIILKNGNQIVEDIINSPNINKWVKNKGDKLVFDKDLFLKSFETSKK